MAMGNFENQSLIFFLIFFSTQFLFSCTDQKNKQEINLKSQKNNSMENHKIPKRFDIQSYESKIKKDPFYEGYQKDSKTFVKQYHILKNGYVEENYTKEIVQNYVEEIITEDRFRTVYTFDNKGILYSIKKYFGNNLEIGEWIYFQDEKKTNVEDKDSGYQFLIHDVINYAKSKNLNLLKTGDIERIRYHEQNFPAWKIKWNTGTLSADGESYLFKEIILDGKTGRELESKDFFLNPLAR